MALKKIKSTSYIKINIDGTFQIYKTKKDRELEKQATPSSKIIAKYKNIITQFQQNKERCYYDPDFYQLLNDWESEYKDYSTALLKGIKIKKLPLISQYYPDACDSLPNILMRGQVGMQGTTLAEVYDYVKQCGYFPDIIDC